jgi:glycine/D-amino acid oxidase-like deaminating enzyme
MRDIGDVVIIGGGAAGCAAAYYLGQAGVKATLIEREGIGMQASGYSAASARAALVRGARQGVGAPSLRVPGGWHRCAGLT